MQIIPKPGQIHIKRRQNQDRGILYRLVEPKSQLQSSRQQAWQEHSPSDLKDRQQNQSNARSTATQATIDHTAGQRLLSGMTYKMSDPN